jgi:hypothetical protein
MDDFIANTTVAFDVLLDIDADFKQSKSII